MYLRVCPVQSRLQSLLSLNHAEIRTENHNMTWIQCTVGKDPMIDKSWENAHWLDTGLTQWHSHSNINHHSIFNHNCQSGVFTPLLWGPPTNFPIVHYRYLVLPTHQPWSVGTRYVPSSFPPSLQPREVLRGFVSSSSTWWKWSAHIIIQKYVDTLSLLTLMAL